MQVRRVWAALPLLFLLFSSKNSEAYQVSIRSDPNFVVVLAGQPTLATGCKRPKAGATHSRLSGAPVQHRKEAVGGDPQCAFMSIST